MLRWKSSLKPTDGGGGVPTPDLLWWKMKPGSGTAIDADVGSDGTFDGTWSTGASGSGYSIESDGTETASTDSSIAYGSNIITISFWASFDTFSNDYMLNNTGTGNGTFEIYASSASSVLFRLFGSSGERRTTVTTTLSTATWYNFFVVFDNSTASGDVKVWLNGSRVTNTNVDNKAGTSNIPTGVLNVMHLNASFIMDGRVDDLRIWAGDQSAHVAEVYANPDAGDTSYKATVLADTPLFYYRLGETSGTNTAYDEVATSSNGTYNNTPSLGQTGAISGDSNTSCLFEEANSEDMVTTTLTSETSLLPCTIECFLKTSGASDAYAGIFFLRGSTASASGLNIRGSTLGKLGYHWNNAGNTYGYSGAPTLSDDTWYYVALVVESTKATFYVIDESGTLTTATNSVTHSAINASADPWKIARDSSYARYFQGYIDEVAIYDQALSQSTVVAHAAAAGYTASGSAPVYDAYAHGGVANGSSIPSFNINIGSGGNAAVIVSVRSEPGDSGVTPAADITVTVGGTSATLISGATGTGFASNHLFGIAMGSATGNQAVVVSWTSGNAYNHAVASSFTGVNQTTPFDNGTGQAVGYAATSDTLAITSATGDLTFSDFGENGGVYETVTVNNTQQYNLLGSDGRAVGSTAAGAASVDHIATITTYSSGGAHVGCNINAV